MKVEEVSKKDGCYRVKLKIKNKSSYIKTIKDEKFNEYRERTEEYKCEDRDEYFTFALILNTKGHLDLSEKYAIRAFELNEES
jgi:hypothetical protein